MKQVQRLSAGWVLLLGLTMMVAACGAQPADQATTSAGGETTESTETGGTEIEPVTLTYIHPHAGAYTDAIEMFEASHPGVTIEEQAIPFNEMITQVQARLGSGDDTLDLIAVDPPRLGNMVLQNFLDPVDEAGAAATAEAVSKVGLESVTWDGQQYAYPIWTSVNFLFYNKAALDKAGIEYPSDDPADRMTWEEVLADAKAVQDAGGADYGLGIEQIDRYYALQPLLMSMGADPGLGGDDGTEVNITSDKWVEFGNWYAQIHESGLAPRGIDASQMPDTFGAGQVAYFLAAPTRITVFQDSSVADGWGIAPHPYFEGGDIVTPTDSWAVGVSAYSKHKELAHEFAQFMTLDLKGMTSVSAKLNLPPVNQEAYTVYLERMVALVPDALGGMEAIITDDENYAAHRPSSVGYVEFETAMNKAFSDIRNGTDVVTTLQSTQDNLERQLAKYAK